jgi:hypothetical protein
LSEVLVVIALSEDDRLWLVATAEKGWNLGDSSLDGEDGADNCLYVRVKSC